MASVHSIVERLMISVIEIGNEMITDSQGTTVRPRAGIGDVHQQGKHGITHGVAQRKMAKFEIPANTVCILFLM